MKSCCVPFCKSRGFKGSKISFHEFPSNLKMREAWIKAVARIDPKTNSYWIPSDTSTVCSLHFTTDQFSDNVSRAASRLRRLRGDSVPSIFPGYPEYLLQNSFRFSSIPNKNALNENAINNSVLNNTACNQVKQVQIPKILGSTTSDSSGKNHSSSCNKSFVLPCKTDHPNIIEAVEENGNDSTLIDNSVENNPETSAIENASNSDSSTQNFDSSVQIQKNFQASKYPITRTILRGTTKTKQDETSMKENYKLQFRMKYNKKIKYIDKTKKLVNDGSEIFKKKISSAERRIRKYKAEILKLREENSLIKFTNELMSEKFEEYNIEELQKGIENKDLKALFLLDQLRSLTKKRILWSEKTMKFAKCFERKFPASYTFLKRSDILNLPCTKILRHSLEDTNDDD